MSIRYIICKAEDHEKQQIWITAIFTMHNKYYQCDRHKMMIVAGAGGGGKYSCSLENTNGMNCNTIFKLHYLHTFLPSLPVDHFVFSPLPSKSARKIKYKVFSWIVNAHEFNKLINETVSCSSSTPDQTLKPACLQPLNCGASSSSALAQTGWGQRDPLPSLVPPHSVFFACVL